MERKKITHCKKGHLFDKTNTSFNKKETSKHQIGTINSLAVDHNHITGKTMGLLCSRCNMGIGFLNDDPSILTSAIKYLNKEKHG